MSIKEINELKKFLEKEIEELPILRKKMNKIINIMDRISIIVL